MNENDITGWDFIGRMACSFVAVALLAGIIMTVTVTWVDHFYLLRHIEELDRVHVVR